MNNTRKGLNKKEVCMGVFESSLELLATSRGVLITDCELGDAVYIPNDKFNEFIKELIELKENKV